MRRNLAPLFLFALLAGCASGPTTIQVDALPNSIKTAFSVWDEKGKAIIERAEAGKPVSLPPGRYTVTRQGSMRWVWAKDVDLRKGTAIVIKLGALKVVPPEGIEENMSIQDLEGNWVSELDLTGKLVAAPAGTWRIAAYLDKKWTWGDVTVKEGALSELAVGAIKVTVPAGTVDPGVSVHDPASGDRLSELRPIGKPFVSRVGKIRLQSYLDITVLAPSMDVAAGRVADVPLGAVRWNGAAARVELVTKDGARARTHTFEKGKPIAVPPGAWKIAMDGKPDAVLAELKVEPGAVAEAN